MIFQQFNLVGRLDVLSNVLMGRLSAVPTWRSGAGKSTLLRVINRLIDPSAGRILCMAPTSPHCGAWSCDDGATDDPGKAPALDTERRVGNRSRGAEIPRNVFDNKHAQSTATADGLAGALYNCVTPPAADAVLCE
jgi:energy-coupling factor transporter ATP-binding protein EcfA2